MKKIGEKTTTKYGEVKCSLKTVDMQTRNTKQ